MSDLLNEDRISLSDLARREGVALSTVWRWSLRGSRGALLETISIGAKRYTSEQAFARFIAQCTSIAKGNWPASKRTTHQRDAAIRSAEAELNEAGI